MLKVITMVKSKQKTKINGALRIITLVAAAILLALSPLQATYADSYDDQIRALEREVSGYQDEAARLRTEANTLQNKVNALTAEKSRLQAQIDLNSAKVA